MFVLNDAREYVFPLFTVLADENANSINIDSRVYLGTAFFVTKRGDAVASAHTVPAPEDLPKGHRLVAIVVDEGIEKACWVTHAARLDPFDFALVKVNLSKTKFLPVTTEEVSNGVDVLVLGIPDHELNASGKEMRTLKGHVTLSGKRLELNFPIPAGMSGAPVFLDKKVAGYATGVARTEELEDSLEEETIHKPTGELVVKRTEIKRIISYGIARPFSQLKDYRDPVLSDKTLFEFIEEQNRES